MTTKNPLSLQNPNHDKDSLWMGMEQLNQNNPFSNKDTSIKNKERLGKQKNVQNSQNRKNRANLFWAALENKDLGEVELLLDNDICPETPQLNTGKTPLNFAIQTQNYDLVRLLFEKKASLANADQHSSVMNQILRRDDLKMLCILNEYVNLQTFTFQFFGVTQLKNAHQCTRWWEEQNLPFFFNFFKDYDSSGLASFTGWLEAIVEPGLFSEQKQKSVLMKFEEACQKKTFLTESLVKFNIKELWTKAIKIDDVKKIQNLIRLKLTLDLSSKFSPLTLSLIEKSEKCIAFLKQFDSTKDELKKSFYNVMYIARFTHSFTHKSEKDNKENLNSKNKRIIWTLDQIKNIFESFPVKNNQQYSLIHEIANCGLMSSGVIKWFDENAPEALNITNNKGQIPLFLCADYEKIMSQREKNSLKKELPKHHKPKEKLIQKRL